jgi:hypothetical protein
MASSRISNCNAPKRPRPATAGAGARVLCCDGFSRGRHPDRSRASLATRDDAATVSGTRDPPSNPGRSGISAEPGRALGVVWIMAPGLVLRTDGEADVGHNRMHRHHRADRWRCPELASLRMPQRPSHELPKRSRYA